MLWFLRLLQDSFIFTFRSVASAAAGRMNMYAEVLPFHEACRDWLADWLTGN